MIRLVAAVLALCAPASASAHSFWLEPETHEAEPGAAIEIAFKVGDAGDVEDWGLYWERVAAFQLYSPTSTHDQQSALRMSAAGEAGSARIITREPGYHVVAFASNPSLSELEAGRFNDYLEHEGLRAIQADRDARAASGEVGTELYARRAKALLKIGAGGPDGALTKAIGQTLEIVPLANPFTLPEGAPLGLRLLWRGAPLAGASLAVARLDQTGQAEIVMTDANGEASVKLGEGRRFLVSSVWGVPAPKDTRADYFTIFASLTFAR